MYLRPIPESEATGALADLYAADRQATGFLPEYSQVFSHHPDAYSAWRQLISSVRGQMDLRRCELATLAAARTLRSSYCSTAHGKVLSERWYEEDMVAAMVADHRSAGLDPVDVAVMDFAEKVASDATSITAADVDALREHGLSERDILDIVLAVAARCFFATVVESMAAGPDPEMMAPLSPELREALLVGRRPT
ncbi:MAG TPA: peroxidase-related enzyme [Acidimicrobiia bacterium]|nr:peroxidase-related enzyme [Acidimicrobiia bacterium]